MHQINLEKKVSNCGVLVQVSTSTGTISRQVQLNVVRQEAFIQEHNQIAQIRDGRFVFNCVS